jgi:YegS/Rv2252/BmrU family lipid kinase
MTKRNASTVSTHPRTNHVAVVAHAGKTFGGGRRELRRVLAAAGHAKPLWYEVPKSSKARKAIRRAIKDGADVIFVWGGDGMVQRAIDAIVDGAYKVPVAILPAGTANLLAKNLEIPADIAGAVALGLQGVRQPLDVGVVNGERFAVMAGTGVDAITMRDVSKSAKRRIGRLAYFRSGMSALRTRPVQTKIDVNGKAWFSGKASCVLVGNVGTIGGGIKLFPKASPIDGKLELAVVTSDTEVEWARVFARVATGHASRSPFVRTTRATRVSVKMETTEPYELDGGDREPTKELEFRVEAHAITVCIPRSLTAARRAPRKRRTPRGGPGRAGTSG